MITNSNVSKKLSFGLGAVNMSKRGNTAEPELIINPTVGAFRLTAPVSKALALKSGDNVMFVSNIIAIDTAIAEKDESLVAFCEEKGLDITTPEAAKAIHAEFDIWGIAKGIPLFDSKGNKQVATERMTKDDKKAWAESHFDELMAAAKKSDNAELNASLEVEGITKEQQIEILATIVTPDEIHKHSGAKTANPSNLTGIGVTLNFSDAAAWAALKENLGEAAKTTNRIYSVDISNLQEVSYNNGYEDKLVKVALLTEYRDEVPTRGRDAKKAEDAKDAE